MPSFEKTLRKWYWTVRGLMNNLAPISGFESPSRANIAIWISCEVSSSLVSTLRFRALSPVADNSRFARPANASAPMAVNCS
jgi:hypothetical protein